MFGKSDQARVTETLAVIQTAPVSPIDAALDVSPVGRGLVCTWLLNLYPRLSPSDQQAFHELSQSLSVKANIGRNVAKAMNGSAPSAGPYSCCGKRSAKRRTLPITRVPGRRRP